MENVLGPESEEELAAYLSQLRAWQEGGGGPPYFHDDSYTDSSITFGSEPSLPLHPMDEREPRRLVMKRKVLRHRPDGTVEVSDESPNVMPWSLEYSSDFLDDPASETETSSDTLKNCLHYDDDDDDDDDDRLREEGPSSLVGDFGSDTISEYSMPRHLAMNYIAPKARRVKRTDPVAKLNKYKQDWKRFCVPGQDPHERLRRAVHRQILQTGLPRRPQRPVIIPNTYEVPTMKKRDSLRFGVRWDLAHHLMPRRNTSY